MADDDDLKHLVFVYGTLKRGEPNMKWLTEEAVGTFKVLATGKTVKKFVGKSFEF